MFLINFYTFNVILVVLLAIDIPLKIIDFRENKKRIKQDKITQAKIDWFKKYVRAEEKRFNEAEECEITQRWIDGKVKVIKYFKEKNDLLKS